MVAGIFLTLCLVLAMAHDVKKINRLEGQQDSKLVKIDSLIKSKNPARMNCIPKRGQDKKPPLGSD
jgi:hypothetical protein